MKINFVERRENMNKCKNEELSDAARILRDKNSTEEEKSKAAKILAEHKYDSH